MRLMRTVRAREARSRGTQRSGPSWKGDRQSASLAPGSIALGVGGRRAPRARCGQGEISRVQSGVPSGRRGMRTPPAPASVPPGGLDRAAALDAVRTGGVLDRANSSARSVS